MSDQKHEKIALMHKNGKAMALFEWMKFTMGKNNALIVSMDAMADIFGCSRRTIEKHIKFLRERKLLSVGRTGASNIYHVNASVARWDSNPKTYFELRAKVILGDDETKTFCEKIKAGERTNLEQINRRKSSNES
jgi:hypothetical protein